MLISPASPLRRIPSTVAPRTVLFLDGIRYSIEIVDMSFTRLAHVLEHIANRGERTEGLSSLIVEAISDAWLIVDSVHRLRELVQQCPGLRQREPQVQVLLRNTESVERLRNFVQHFRSEIDAFVQRQMPLWGTLSWSRTAPDTGLPEGHTIIPGTFYHGVRAAGCVFDREERRFVDRVLLEAGPARTDLAAAFDRVASFAPWFERWHVETHGSAAHHGADVHLKMIVRLAAREPEELVERPESSGPPDA